MRVKQHPGDVATALSGRGQSMEKDKGSIIMKAIALGWSRCSQA